MKRLFKWSLVSALIVLVFFSGVACGVRYMMNSLLLMNSREALVHSSIIKTRDDGVSKSLEMYESSMWQWIAMLHDIETSKFSTSGHRQAARHTSDRIISYFQKHGADYVREIEEHSDEVSLAASIDEAWDRTQSTNETEDEVIKQMKPLVKEAVEDQLQPLLDQMQDLNMKALVIYRQRTQRNSSSNNPMQATPNGVPDG